MYPKIAHIFGPIYIQSYGAAIVMGLLTLIHLLRKNKRFCSLISKNQFHTALSLGIISGIIGGRILYLISEWHLQTALNIGALWEGGFSILGTILGVLLFVSLYLYYQGIQLLPVLDCVALYAPLTQAIARIGCFLAGCCFGKPTSLPWAITYTNNDSLAPCFVPRHPTQLYSALGLFLIFLIMQTQKNKPFMPGTLTALYLVLMSTERFFIDFFRADRIFFANNFLHSISVHQFLASGILIIVGILFIIYSTLITSRSSV